MVRIHSPRPIHPTQIKRVLRRREWLFVRAFFVTMAKTMATPNLLRTVHGCEDGFCLRMNISSCGREITVTSQIGQGVGVHVGRPAGQASVAQCVNREGFNLCQRECFAMLLF